MSLLFTKLTKMCFYLFNAVYEVIYWSVNLSYIPRKKLLFLFNLTDCIALILQQPVHSVMFHLGWKVLTFSEKLRPRVEISGLWGESSAAGNIQSRAESSGPTILENSAAGRFWSCGTPRLARNSLESFLQCMRWTEWPITCTIVSGLWIGQNELGRIFDLTVLCLPGAGFSWVTFGVPLV